MVVIGVLGGGQLGRMMTIAGHRLGLQVIPLDPKGKNSPAGQVAIAAEQGAFSDRENILSFSQHCDIITAEIEHVDCTALFELEKKGFPVHPSASTLSTIQDKLAQKIFVQKNGVPVQRFMEIATEDDGIDAGRIFGYPFMLKARRLAYDGRGNMAVRSEDDVSKAFKALGGENLYAEAWVFFKRELAVMVARNTKGEVSAYPVVETTQKNNICHCVLAPATINDSVSEHAQAVALQAVACFNGAGIFGVELFETQEGDILYNEIAPRPHNSGHYTLEACETDQFEQHLRAIMGLPLGGTKLIVGAALMVNILGTGDRNSTDALVSRYKNVDGARLHMYGKDEDKIGRKMGHVTCVAEDMKQLYDRVYLFGTSEATALLLPVITHVGIVMGSDSDLPTMQAAAQILETLGVSYELTIVSAHRTPERMVHYAQTAMERGIKVIIAGAGGAAHLPGMIAALTTLPVIGVPIKTSTLSGVDSLHSIVQMPRGVPVATVAIGNALNAGLLAARMLALNCIDVRKKLIQWRNQQQQEVLVKAERLETIGYKEYLATMNLM